jgi:drug/metabolite transporter (DMT)-like permease
MTGTATDAVAARSSSHLLHALAWMAGALVSFTLVAVAAREASRQIDSLQILLYRALISLAIIVSLAWASGQGFAPWRTKRLALHALRSSIHFIAQFNWLYALTLIPLAQLFALEFTAPLWVALTAPLLLRERMTATRLVAALVGFAGTMIVVRPGAVGANVGSTLALLAALGFAVSMITTKQLTRTESAMTILFYMSAIQTGLAAVISRGRMTIPDSITLFWVTLVGICGLTAHFSWVRAFALADAIIVAPMDFLRLPLIALVGAWVYAETLEPIVLLGGGVVVLANLINLWGERRRGEQKPARYRVCGTGGSGA